MRSFKFTLVIVLLVFAAGCSGRAKLLEASMVSMTKYNSGDYELKETGPIKGKFCSDLDDEEVGAGLIDLAVLN
ncbi:MAG: hypothetical protein AAF202_07520, partial [Pseudomonadota bacterium]